MEKCRLQQYEDGTFEYLGINGNEKYNLTTESLVVCMRGEDEDREEFISKNGITFSKNQYGSNERMDKLLNSKEMRDDVLAVGYGLDKLINDEDWVVRREVAKQGYGLDILVNDEKWNVRMVVAEQGYGLAKLVNDKERFVREAVAKQGYGLDILYYDSDEYVREAVEDYLKENDLTLAQRTRHSINFCVVITKSNRILGLFSNSFFCKFNEITPYQIVIKILGRNTVKMLDKVL